MWYGGDGSFTREREKMKEASLIFFSEFSPDHLSTGTGKNEKSIFDIFFFSEFSPDHQQGEGFLWERMWSDGNLGVVWRGWLLSTGTGKNEKRIFDIFFKSFSRLPFHGNGQK